MSLLAIATSLLGNRVGIFGLQACSRVSPWFLLCLQFGLLSLCPICVHILKPFLALNKTSCPFSEFPDVRRIVFLNSLYRVAQKFRHVIDASPFEKRSTAKVSRKRCGWT